MILVTWSLQKNSSHSISGLEEIVSEKYSFLYNHANPPSKLHSTYSNGCNHKFKISWLEKYPWLRHSPRLGVFCGPCFLLIIDSKRSDKFCLVNRSFSKWVKISDTLSKHSKLSYYNGKYIEEHSGESFKSGSDDQQSCATANSFRESLHQVWCSKHQSHTLQ